MADVGIAVTAFVAGFGIGIVFMARMIRARIANHIRSALKENAL